MKPGSGRGGKRRFSNAGRGRRRPAPTDRARAAVVAAGLVSIAIIASVFAGVFRSPRGTIDSDSVALSLPSKTASPSVEEEAPEQDDPLPPVETVDAQSMPENVPADSLRPIADVLVEESVPKGRHEPETSVEKKPEQVVRKTPKKAIDLPAKKTPKPVPVVVRPSSRPEKHPKPSPEPKGVAVIVIDDAGNNLKELEPFLRFPGPLTIAVLPGLPHSAEAARRARAAGKEVILHQPMEALGGQNPGPGAISVGMSDAEIQAILKKNVEEVGPIVGMNNHQGSKVTADERTMRIVLDFCKSRGLFFLDSKTTAESVVPAVAAGTGMSIRERDVFVDNIQERAAMIRYLQEGLQKAEKKGSAVMIGHAWSSELASTLQELYPELIEQGFSLSSIARIMMGTYDDEGFRD